MYGAPTKFWGYSGEQDEISAYLEFYSNRGRDTLGTVKLFSHNYYDHYRNRSIKNSCIYYVSLCQVLRINQSDENPSVHGAYGLVTRNGQQKY